MSNVFFNVNSMQKDYSFEDMSNTGSSDISKSFFSLREAYPEYDDGTMFVSETRKNPMVPFAGYYDDVKRITKSINMDPPKNLINDFLNNAWENSEVSTFIETNAMRRILTFKEKLADSLHARHSKKLCGKVFKAWFQFSFRYITLRTKLLTYYQLNYAGKRFKAWRHVVKLNIKYRNCLRIYWLKHRQIRFRWWKMWTQWEKHKDEMQSKYFYLLVKHLGYKRKLNRKWLILTIRIRNAQMAIRIARAYRRYRLRYYYWAVKTIKKLYLKHFSSRLLKMRRAFEYKRGMAEAEALERMVDKGHFYMRKLLQKSEGKEMLYTYLREINDRYSDTDEDNNLFPDKSIMPELSMQWTSRGKAMHILRCRTGYEVMEFAKVNFRETRPPLYVCPRCDEKFLLVVIARHHRKHCRYVDTLPEYISWKLCQPLVDVALAPVAEMYYKQKIIDTKNKEMERQRMILSAQDVSTKIGREVQKPKYENVRVKPSKTSLKIF